MTEDLRINLNFTTVFQMKKDLPETKKKKKSVSKKIKKSEIGFNFLKLILRKSSLGSSSFKPNHNLGPRLFRLTWKLQRRGNVSRLITYAFNDSNRNRN